MRQKAFGLSVTPTPTPGEMEHFHTLEVEGSAGETFSSVPPQPKSQAAAHLSLRSGPRSLGIVVPCQSPQMPSGNSEMSGDGWRVLLKGDGGGRAGGLLSFGGSLALCGETPGNGSQTSG